MRNGSLKAPLVVSTLLLAILSARPALAYDHDLAAMIAPSIGKLDQATLAKEASKLSVEGFLTAYLKKERMMIIDIRTPAETSLVSLPQSVQIPLDTLFRRDNLDRLPTDEKLVVICHSGSRASLATVLLRAMGFSNAVYLDGGAKALISAATPKALPPGE